MTEPLATEIPVREGDVLAGKYRVERVLGIGGMGVVVAAMHTELDQKVALKVLLPAVAQNPAVVARFSREARAAAKIKSEHVVRVSDVGNLDNGLPFIVMEHLDGEDLSQLLTTATRLSPGVAVDYVLQACEALAEAHAAGFVHRDLKPGNLFLARRPDGSSIIKVLDFGISKAAIGDAEPASAKPGSLTKTTDVFGSPLYMSPEQLKSARDVDARADVWALGVILYELISGKPPFDRATIAETFGAILYEKAQSLVGIEGVTPDLDAAILKCLEKDISVRHQNVAEVAKALFPSADQATRQSIERTSRVLKRAGMAIDTLPPTTAKASTNLSPLSPSASTRTSWGAADDAQKPRSGRAAIFVGAGISLVLGALLLFALTRFAPRRHPTPMPAADPHPTADVTTAPLPSITASTPPTPSVTVTPAASVTAAPATSALATSAVVQSPVAPPPAHGKAPSVKTSLPALTAPPPAQPATAAPVAPPSPPPPAVKLREDPNGFGDRK